MEAALRQARQELTAGHLVVEGSPQDCPLLDTVYTYSGEKWEGFPVFKGEGTSADSALYWCPGALQEDGVGGRWFFCTSYSTLTAEQKGGLGCGHVWCSARENGEVPVDAMPQTWQCVIDNKWVAKPLTVRAKKPSELTRPELLAALTLATEEQAAERQKNAEVLGAEQERRRAEAQAAAMAGFSQGLGYLRTRRVDLSSPAFGTVTETQIMDLAGQTPELEALFLAPGVVLSETCLDTLRRDCPEAACLALGCELSEKGYLELRQQHGRHDDELGALLLARNADSQELEAETMNRSCGCVTCLAANSHGSRMLASPKSPCGSARTCPRCF
jgi:hypothetical protein